MRVLLISTLRSSSTTGFLFARSSSSARANTPFTASRQGVAFTRSNLSTLAAVSSTCDSSPIQQELATQADTTHPSFDKIETSVVSEYGAHCTLYR